MLGSLLIIPAHLSLALAPHEALMEHFWKWWPAIPIAVTISCMCAVSLDGSLLAFLSHWSLLLFGLVSRILFPPKKQLPLLV